MWVTCIRGTLSSTVLRHLNLELNLHSENKPNIDCDNQLSSLKIHNLNKGGVGSSRTMILSQLRSVRGDDKPIPFVRRNNETSNTGPAEKGLVKPQRDGSSTAQCVWDAKPSFPASCVFTCHFW